MSKYYKRLEDGAMDEIAALRQEVKP